MLNCWTVRLLTVDLLNCWTVELLNCRTVELLNCWTVELLSWTVELLNCWTVELLNCWTVHYKNYNEKNLVRRTFSFHSSLSNLKLKILISIKLFRSNSKLLDNSSFGNLSKLDGGLQGGQENQENSSLHIETILGIQSICWPFLISAGHLLI